jgi:hypothetical protein
MLAYIFAAISMAFTGLSILAIQADFGNFAVGILAAAAILAMGWAITADA